MRVSNADVALAPVGGHRTGSVDVDELGPVRLKVLVQGHGGGCGDSDLRAPPAFAPDGEGAVAGVVPVVGGIRT